MGVVMAVWTGVTDAAVASEWSPSNAVNLVAWWDADDDTTVALDSGRVTNWTDKVAARALSSGTAAAPGPHRVSETLVGNRRVMRFNAELGSGITNGLSHPSAPFIALQSVNMLVVMRYRNLPPTGNTVFALCGRQGDAGPYGRFQLYYNTGTNNFRTGWANGVFTNVVDGTVTTDWTLLGLSVVNGTQRLMRAGATVATLANTNVASPKAFGLARNYNDTGTVDKNPAEADFGEIVVLSSDADRERVEGYLAHKWGLAGTLPGGHPYKNAAPKAWTPQGTWSPANMSAGKVALWLDATDTNTLWADAAASVPAAMNGSIGRWNDKSGQGRHAVQGTGTRQPTNTSLSLSGLRTLRFDGNDVLVCSNTASAFNFLHAGKGIVLLVARVGNSADPNALLPFAGNCGGSASGRRGVSLLFDDRSGVPANNRLVASCYENNVIVADARGENAIVPNTRVVITARHDHPNAVAGNRLQAQVNAGTALTNTYTGTASGNASYDWHIGDYASGSFYLQGDVAEMIVVSTQDTADLEKLQGYAAWKWGLQDSLPGNHPYKSEPPYTFSGTVIYIR